MSPDTAKKFVRVALKRRVSRARDFPLPGCRPNAALRQSMRPATALAPRRVSPAFRAEEISDPPRRQPIDQRRRMAGGKERKRPAERQAPALFSTRSP